MDNVILIVFTFVLLFIPICSLANYDYIKFKILTLFSIELIKRQKIHQQNDIYV
ncbi:hypothetical protein [Caloramator sp. ALD01]|uniref:hypothetical protein n=1 Tax=Caloramator sp. ALD01 TaxID=1031288 RepID=UPI000427EC6C|nr:hypothetical protein [Caloramator sp. ALD01]